MTWPAALALTAVLAPQEPDEWESWRECCDLRVSIVQEVPDAPGVFVLGPDDARLHAYIVDSSSHRRDPIYLRGPGGPGPYAADPPPSIQTLELPVDRVIGLCAFSPSCGYAERVLEPDELARLIAANEVVTLVLSQEQRAATLEVHLAPESAIRIEPKYWVTLRTPRTGEWVGWVRLERGGGVARLEAPPGEYILVAEAIGLEGCGHGPPSIAPAVDLRERIVLRPGEERRLDRHLDHGAPLALHIDVANAEYDVEWHRWETAFELDWNVWIEDRLDDDLWTAHATLQRLDVRSEPQRIRFGWYDERWNRQNVLFPLGRKVYATHRFTPGRYRLTVEGPRIETLTTVIEIPWSEDRWPRSERHTVRLTATSR